MRSAFVALVLIALMCLALPARALRSYDDPAAWLAAAGPIRQIDFETPPNADPNCALYLSRSCDYGAQGAVFSTGASQQFDPGLEVRRQSGDLIVHQLNPFGGPRPELDIFLSQPTNAFAVTDRSGNCFSNCPGLSGTAGTLFVYGASDHLLSWFYFSPYDQFFGVVSEVPIVRIQIMAGYLGTGVGAPDVRISDFTFGAVPEPATVLLLGAGVAALAARRRLASRG